MKHLKIEYNDIVLFDGEVQEVIWNDGPGGIRVEGKVRAQSGPGLIELLTAASKARTEEKRVEVLEDPV